VIRQDLSHRAAQLRASRQPFVHTRVVLAERPTSAKPGDEAIVLADGTLEGFVGGECAEATVVRESLSVLRTGRPLLLRVTPTPEPDQENKLIVHNPCLSGGTLEIFLEPSLPAPLVQVVGGSPTALALTALGVPLGYEMAPWSGHVEPGADAMVVASHGKDEQKPLVAALEAGVPYVGLVASRKRGAAVVTSLPVDEEQRARVRTPAGLDIGAATAEEVALSILAEIVQTQPRQARQGHPLVADICTAIDPICGMSVTVTEDARHIGTVYFCGPGCMNAYQAS
jgi:xanthine dehydrogenase accessory factor